MSWTRTRTAAAALLAAACGLAPAAQKLDLSGYSDPGGAITILHGGPASDPYFAMQALLLAHDNGLDIQAPALRFAQWLVVHQKPDGTFDRFCRPGSGAWAPCRTADADDSLLAAWLRLLATMPEAVAATPALRKSRDTAVASLAHLYQPSRGIFMVSPVYLHGLFMDNLEVWALKAEAPPAARGEASALAKAIHSTFWNPVDKRFLVSTQLEQRAEPPKFYPDHVAQIFPMMVGFPLPPANTAGYYREWMRQHRAEWLDQGKADYPWGIVAVLALRQGDLPTARCWLREATPLRHSARWAVTDETSWQILTGRGLAPASARAACG
ncbi:MAG: hypothetical protein ABW051_07600 [Burkholderiaceae bacterium]